MKGLFALIVLLVPIWVFAQTDFFHIGETEAEVRSKVKYQINVDSAKLKKGDFRIYRWTDSRSEVTNIVTFVDGKALSQVMCPATYEAFDYFNKYLDLTYLKINETTWRANFGKNSYQITVLTSTFGPSSFEIENIENIKNRKGF